MPSFYNKYIKSELPLKLQIAFTNLKIFLLDLFRPIRTSKLITKVLGPQYKRSRKDIEIDITYNCNLRCFNCNRSCRQAPTKENMGLEQIEKFIKESKDKNIKWRKVSLVGGEPCLHPDILKIIALLLAYQNEFSKQTKIYLVTNGLIKDVLKNIPKSINIVNSEKQSSAQEGFESFNVAPVDLKEYKNKDFKNGCKILKDCGMGLNMYGYYPCAVAGGIDRIFGFDNARKHLPEKNDEMFDQLNTFCKLCGHFKKHDIIDTEKMSKSWKEAYAKFQDENKQLTRY
jgi:radical SAM family protein/4Fe-4S single cluster protein